MALKVKELCKRIRVIDGEVTYHVVNDEGKLREISETAFRDYEYRATRTDTFYSRGDSKFQRQYKTVHYL